MNIPTLDETDWSYFGALRLRGGTRAVATAVGDAIGNTWSRLLLVNILWFLVLFSIFGIPPVTAMLFFAARRALTKEDISYAATLYGIRRYARDTWLWALPTLGFLLGGYAVSWAVQTQGVSPVAGTAVQVVIALWLGFNLYFWPLWWHQPPTQRAVVATWQATVAYFRTYPVPTIAGVLVLGLVWILLLSVSWLLLPTLFLFVPVTAALLATVIIGKFPPPDS